MNLETGVRDCLCLNWALPVESLGAPPAPLRWDLETLEGRDWVLASALLYRVERVRVESMALPRLAHPQFALRLCAVDGDQIACHLVQCVMTTPWALPGVRWLGRQPASLASFNYPAAGETPGPEGLRWEVRRKVALALRAAASAPVRGCGPDLGGFDPTVAYFHRRRRSYFPTADGLRRVEIEPRASTAVPVTVELESRELLAACLKLPDADWPALHSAWFWPEVAFLFAWEVAPDSPLPRQVPAPG